MDFRCTTSAEAAPTGVPRPNHLGSSVTDVETVVTTAIDEPIPTGQRDLPAAASWPRARDGHLRGARRPDARGSAAAHRAPWRVGDRQDDAADALAPTAPAGRRRCCALDGVPAARRRVPRRSGSPAATAAATRCGIGSFGATWSSRDASRSRGRAQQRMSIVERPDLRGPVAQDSRRRAERERPRDQAVSVNGTP